MTRFIFLLFLAGTGSLAAESARSFRLPSLYHVGFWVRDIAKARAYYHDYLGFDEPYSLNYPDGRLQMVVMKVNERQVIYLFTDATKILPNGDNLDHLGLETDDLAAVRTHLLANGVKVGEIHRGRIGDLLLGVKDPDGHSYEITQFTAEGQLRQHEGKGLSANRISDHLRSATLTVADLPAALHFYQDILGFRKISSDPVRVQVPDGTDYLELRVAEKSATVGATRAVPAFTLEVADETRAAALLKDRAARAGFAPPSTLAGSGPPRRLAVVDPDGTTVILQRALNLP